MENSYTVPLSEPDPVEQVTNTLRGELRGLFQVLDVSSQSSGQVITFTGHLQVTADSSYGEIRRRFRSHGYTPAFRRVKGQDLILAMEGVVDRPKTGNPLINIALFAATVVTTLSFGARLEIGRSLFEAVLTGSPLAVLQAILAGLPYAITLLGILGIHELGHYVAARFSQGKSDAAVFHPPALWTGDLGCIYKP